MVQEFKATLTEEQKAILQNHEMTREQKRKALQECYTEEQRAMLQQNRQVREQNREMLRNNMTEAQREQIRNNGIEESKETQKENMAGNGGNGGTRRGQ